MENRVILVDIYDNPIGEMEKLEAHKCGALHRAGSVFVVNSQGQLLLQRRALSKYHSAGLWKNTACTHPFLGESNEQAASRRLIEEMGITATTMTKIFDFVYNEPLNNALTEHEFDHVFLAFSDEKPKPNPIEVEEYIYMPFNEILEKVDKSPEEFTVWFKKIIGRVFCELRKMELANLYP